MNKNIKYSITFISLWQCTSGLGAGSDVDLMSIKDKNNLPYIPGKTIKGLLKEMIEIIDNKNSGDFISVFGSSGDKLGQGANSFFSDAQLSQNDRNNILTQKLTSYLYQKVASTAINEKGIAKEGSLRAAEVAIPCTLEGMIYNVPQEYIETLIKGLKLIKRLGAGRNRGYGLCSFNSFEEIVINNDNTLNSELTQTTSEGTSFKFKCKLLSDLIISENSGTEGARITLDYIPGNVFLGIAARNYKDFKEPVKVFHNGSVKFSDAHPLSGDNRTYRIPFVVCHSKDNYDDYYLYHLIKNPSELRQLEMERKGFYSYKDNIATKVNIFTSLSLKSAYNSKTQSSMEGQMFSYESINKGLEFSFTIDVDDLCSEDKNLLLKNIVGQHRIGTSHSAQYGLVEIERYKYNEIGFNEQLSDVCFVYADSRLMFSDELGYPTCTISAQDLGFDGEATINWDKSVVRTFQFAPWNGKREVRDSDRWGIEKGSVFVIEKAGKTSCNKRYVGIFQQEGFGQVLINPAFLFSSEPDGFIAKYSSELCEGEAVNQEKSNNAESSTFILALEKLKNNYDMMNSIYKDVDDFQTNYTRDYINISSSQWGTIRNKALNIMNSNQLIKEITEMISTGAASEKWKSVKDDFISKIKKQENLRLFLINLSSVMAKK